VVNWLKTWRRASFRGARFWVDEDEIETGRRLVVHEFPHRDAPYIEDMGRTANRIEVTAYVASDAAIGEQAALMAACEARGAATLQLPAARLKAHCERCERAWDKDKQGRFAFRLTFWRDGTGAAPTPAPYLARLTFAAAAETAAPLAAAFLETFRTTGEAGFVRDQAAEDLRLAAAAIDAVRAGLPLDPAKAPALARAVQDLYDEAESLTAVGETGDTWSATSFVADGGGSRAAPVVERIAALVSGLREASPDQAAAARSLADLTEYGLDLPTGGNTPSSRQMRANAAALALTLRVAALTQWAVAKTEIEYGDRRAAIQARADVAEAIDAELDRLSGDKAYGLYVALSETRGHAVEFFTRLLTDLAPVVIVSTGVPMPSLWLANMLYGDAERAGELARRNRVIHPSFMPTDIEALGS
jgi:prophage DNA circulation protein